MRAHSYPIWSFNAARGFVGGAAPMRSLRCDGRDSFNAARGFVGGAAGGFIMKNNNMIKCFNAARGFVGGATFS